MDVLVVGKSMSWFCVHGDTYTCIPVTMQLGVESGLLLVTMVEL